MDRNRTIACTAGRGQSRMETALVTAFQEAADAFEGEAAKAGFETEEQMQDYMKEIRKEQRRKQDVKDGNTTG